jgi:4-hydroxy-tetrahydrodipicolinate synthase
MVMYNVPSRTGVSIAPETVARLAEHPRIAAIKEASGSVETSSAIRSLCDIAILAGDDSLFLPVLAVGGRGVVSVAGHLVAPDLVALQKHFDAGEVDKAAEIHGRLHPLLRALFLESNPGPVKHALHRLGWTTADVRLPLVPVRPDTAAAIDRVLERLQLRSPARAAG